MDTNAMFHINVLLHHDGKSSPPAETSQPKIHTNVLATWSPLQTPFFRYKSLHCLPDLLAGFWGQEVRNEKIGECGEGRGEKWEWEAAAVA